MINISYPCPGHSVVFFAHLPLLSKPTLFIKRLNHIREFQGCSVCVLSVWSRSRPLTFVTSCLLCAPSPICSLATGTAVGGAPFPRVICPLHQRHTVHIVPFRSLLFPVEPKLTLSSLAVHPSLTLQFFQSVNQIGICYLGYDV